MNARLTVTGFLAALACTAALAGTALAEDREEPPSEGIEETLPDETGDPFVDEIPGDEVVEDPGVTDEGGTGDDGTIVDDGDIYETEVIDRDEGEPVENLEDGGDAVAYGPDDCIDCNVAPTTAFDGEDRGGAETQRGGNRREAASSGGFAISRDTGGSGRPACGSLRPHDMRPCDK